MAQSGPVGQGVNGPAMSDMIPVHPDEDSHGIIVAPMLPPEDYFADPAFQILEAEFHNYIAQGQGRNPVWLVNKTGLPLKVVAQGMTKGMWIPRIHAIARDAAKLSREQVVGDVSGLNTRDVAALTELVDEAKDELLQAIRDGRVTPATLVKIIFGGMQIRADRLGLGQGQEGDIVSRMQKFLENTQPAGEAKPFVLDREKLAAPPELPSMPGMTSDMQEAANDPD